MIQDTEADLRDVIRQQRETMDLMEKGFQYAKALNQRAAELLRKWETPGIDVEWLKERVKWFQDAGVEK